MNYQFEIMLIYKHYNADIELTVQVEANSADDFVITGILEPGEDRMIALHHTIRDDIREGLVRSEDFQRLVDEKIQFINEGRAEKVRNRYKNTFAGRV